MPNSRGLDALNTVDPHRPEVVAAVLEVDKNLNFGNVLLGKVCQETNTHVQTLYIHSEIAKDN